MFPVRVIMVSMRGILHETSSVHMIATVIHDGKLHVSLMHDQVREPVGGWSFQNLSGSRLAIRESAGHAKNIYFLVRS